MKWKRWTVVPCLLAAVVAAVGCSIDPAAYQTESGPEAARHAAEPYDRADLAEQAGYPKDDSVQAEQANDVDEGPSEQANGDSGQADATGNDRQAEHAAADDGQTEQGQDRGTVALPWTKVPDLPPIRRLDDWPQSVEKTIREFDLYGFDGIRVTVYAKKGDADYLHAALTAKDGVYDLGGIAGYGYDKDGDVTVEDVFLFKKQLIKLTGTVGASASMTRYVSLDNGVPKPVLFVDTGHVRHLDLDFDGREEVVASAGTLARTYVYRWNEDHAEMCDLNEALGASSVSISPERAVEAFSEKTDTVGLFWLTPDGLRSISTYSREEYVSDRFVNIPYTEQELREIEQLADRVGLLNPFVAGKGVATDYGVQASIRENDILQLSYPHFSVRQSARDLMPRDGTTVLKLNLGSGSANWIEYDGGAGSWYLQRNDTSISIGSAKPVNREQLLFVAMSLVSLDEKLPEPEKPLMVTRDYLLALNAMNEFLTAWLHRDAKSGVNWVSDEVKRKTDPEVLAAHFAGVSNPHHQAFEVTGKKRINEDTYAFDVSLYEYYTAQPDSVNGLPYKRDKGITYEVVRQGEDEWGQPIWRVNRLP